MSQRVSVKNGPALKEHRRAQTVAQRDTAFATVLRVLDAYRPKGEGVEVEAETAKIRFLRAELASMRAWLVHVPEDM